ncbi:MAG: phosphatidate cytidylyltransferase [Methylobacterium sp.]|uniref:phosphatidate cytidylyltransferase n=1 Tax=Methylobacterium sp. TaxID=409 RepID=UPI0025DF460C|nr:phosphatidate cytidylyltransferase [Methylobacterium sp.]MBX9931429.1 phosphatidate cytidylyltransferase [Methylobacterium sp.]
MPAGGGSAPSASRRRDRLGGSEFRLRAISGVILAVAVVAALFIGGWPFALVWLVAGIVGAAEWIAMSRLAPGRGLLAVTVAALIGLVICARLEAPLLASALLVIAASAVLVVLAKGITSRLQAVVGLLGASVIAVVPSALRDDPGIGVLGPAWMFAVVWSTDVVAYITGRMIGGPKLMPRVSPNKTWSGSLGGLSAGIIAGTSLVLVARAQGWSALAETSLILVALASALASISSQAGDLAESALKRHWGVKDSGRSIPGHGGVMDRLDGFFAVAVLAGLYLVARRIAAA